MLNVIKRLLKNIIMANSKNKMFKKILFYIIRFLVYRFDRRIDISGFWQLNIGKHILFCEYSWFIDRNVEIAGIKKNDQIIFYYAKHYDPIGYRS